MLLDTIYADPTEAAAAADPLDPPDAADDDDDDAPELHQPRVIIGQVDSADEPPEPDPPAPPFPVAARPGTEAKILAMAARADVGVSLWHPLDMPMCRESSALGNVGRQHGLRHAYGRRFGLAEGGGHDAGDGL